MADKEQGAAKQVLQAANSHPTRSFTMREGGGTARRATCAKGPIDAAVGVAAQYMPQLCCMSLCQANTARTHSRRKILDRNLLEEAPRFVGGPNKALCVFMLVVVLATQLARLSSHCAEVQAAAADQEQQASRLAQDLQDRVHSVEAMQVRNTVCSNDRKDVQDRVHSAKAMQVGIIMSIADRKAFC
eukprot:1018124-Pelagomonas_calceolata.AAC.2